MVKIFISPNFTGEDKGSHGGIRRVVDAQREYFKSNITDDHTQADVIAIHAGSMIPVRPDQTMIAHCHGLYWSNYAWQGNGHRTINNAVLNSMQLSDYITAPTEWVANSLRHTMSRKVSVIGHAVDPDWVPGQENLGYVLWNKSRIDKVCDPAPVLKLASLMPDIEFRMTVGPRERPKNVTVTGLTSYTDKTPVQQAGVYFATAQETFGIGILEALACGVPVCGWNWGGQAELITHKVNGYLARVGDYDDLREGILYCLNNHDKMRDACIQTAKLYTWENACKKYEELYLKPRRHGVSIVIRNYNTGVYLQDAMNSVVGQLDSENDEVIVLDDCSTDESEEAFNAVKDTIFDGRRNIRWVQTPKNLYLSGALNHGISQTKGEYIVLLDADNMLAPRAIETMKAALDKDRKIDIAYGRVQFVHEDGHTPASELTHTNNGVSGWPPEKFNLDAQLSHKNQIPCTTMYRYKVWDNIGPYRNRCKVAEDADFWCRAVTLGYTPKLVTNAVTLIYRYRQNTTSQTVKDWPWEKWYSLDHGLETLDPCVVSVIIPVGPGHELLLQDACDSVYLQTYKNWECIIINDTGQELKVPVWARILNTAAGNKGPAYARNIGLNNAKSKVALFLDADDYLAHDALAKMLQAFNGVNYVYPDYYRMRDRQRVSLPNNACETLKTTMPHLVTGLYPILDNVRFDESLPLYEDWDFALNMTLQGHCGVRVPEPLVYYRRESGMRASQDSPEIRQPIIAKWGDIEMGNCNSCAKNKPKPVSSMLGALGAPQVFDASKMTMLEYIGTADKQYFIGKSTGQTYSFGTLSNHKIKYVWNEDVPVFLARYTEFRLYANQLVTA